MGEQIKRYAYFINQDRQISVSEALWLRENGEIETTGKKPVFFDFKNPNIRNGVYPVSSSTKKINRGAHYRYYSKEDRKEIIYPKEMTNAHLFFQMMFLQLKKFRIEDRESGNEIRVAVNSAEMEYYVKVDSHKGILIDVLLDIKQTYPYSYKYLWNKKLAVEVKVTHAVDPKKKRILRENNITTYEATVPEIIREKIPETYDLLDSEELRKSKVKELKMIYENEEKWTLFGNFIVKSSVEDCNKENFLMLSQAEIELKKYKKIKEKLCDEIQKFENYKLEILNNVDELEKQANDLELKIQNNQEVLLNFQKSKQKMEKISQELDQKNQTIEKLEDKNEILENSVNDFKNENIIEWVKRKCFKNPENKQKSQS